MRSQIDRDYLAEQNALLAFASEEQTAGVIALPATRRRRTFARVVGVLAAVGILTAGTIAVARVHRELARASAVADVSQRELADSEVRIRELAARSAERLSATKVPPTALVFPLMRARASAAELPQNRVTLSDSPTWVILLAEFASRSTSNRYRATLDGAEGQTVWTGDRLSVSRTRAVAVGLRSNLLLPGEYVLTVDEQTPASDTWLPAGRYPFSVVSEPR
ncbi:MAG TPA: hypothetical protein VLV86_06345 [Vicinamibacterales bacterium]|nr:hypothetical protein [Vicinamibacterales bacterium]